MSLPKLETLSTPMLDGCKCGTGIGLERMSATELGTEVTLPEFEYMKRVLLNRLEGVTVKNLTHATVYSLAREDAKYSNEKDDYTSVKVSCNIWRGKYYFNVEGNPISFLTGQNVLGVSHLVSILKLFYAEIEKSIQLRMTEFVLPKSVMKALDELNVHIHRLAFACYTPELGIKDWRKMDRFFSAIDSIYTAHSKLRGETVKQHFKLDVTREGNYSLRFDKKSQDVRYWSLGMYNKAVEIEAATKQVAPDWTAKRIRLDLTLHSRWFELNRCKSLADIQRKLKGTRYKDWIYQLIQSCLEETRVQYLLGFELDENSLDVGQYRKTFEAWMNHRDVINDTSCKASEGCLAWFLEQGLDLTIPMNIHYVVGLSRSTFMMGDGRDDKAILGDKEAQRRSASRLVDGLNNKMFKPISERACLIQPDTTFGRFTREKTKRGMVWVDTSTGEVLR